jgi:hypothetical protein
MHEKIHTPNRMWVVKRGCECSRCWINSCGKELGLKFDLERLLF